MCLLRLATIGFCASIVAQLPAAVRYQNLRDQRMRSDWHLETNGSLNTRPATAWIDLDGNGVVDVAFEHGYSQSTVDLPADGIGIANAARHGLAQIQSELQRISQIAASVASSDVPMDTGQQQATIHVDRIERIVDSVRWFSDTLLDGSYGILATNDRPEFAWLSAAPDAAPGEYPIRALAAAEIAQVSAVSAQMEPLASFEVLTINGVNISLDAGMTQAQVRDRINHDLRSHGIVAAFEDGRTIVQSERRGSRSTVQVISNRAAASNSSGFGTSSLIDHGSDGLLEIAGTEIPWSEKIVTVKQGPARGIRFAFASDDGALDAAGDLGTIRVTDQTLRIPIDEPSPGRPPTFQLALPDVRPANLGISDITSVTTNLRELDFLHHIADAVETIERASDEVSRAQADIGRTLWSFSDVDGSTRLFLRTGIGVVANDLGGLLLLDPLQRIDDQRHFVTGPLTVAIQPNGDTLCHDRRGFLGLVAESSSGKHYGWVRVTVHCDSTLTLHESAWERTPDMPIVAGPVPEPIHTMGWLTVLLASYLLRSENLLVAKHCGCKRRVGR